MARNVQIKCRLNASICNNKQRWNEDKCMCACEELKVYVTKDLFRFQVIVNVNVINHVMLVNI